MYPVHPVYPPHHDQVSGAVYCAPEVVDSNVKKTDAVLAQLAANELKSSDLFKTKVADIAQLPAGEAKTNAYFTLVGVSDPSNSSEVLNLIYARQIDQKYVNAVSGNLQLTDTEAKMVIQRVTTALQPR